MVVLNGANKKEIPEFPCLIGRQACAASARGGRLLRTPSFLRRQECIIINCPKKTNFKIRECYSKT